MTTTLITGATRGLGLEAARALAEAGHTVLLGARDPAGAAAHAATEVARAAGGRVLPLDITDEESVRAAAAEVAAREGSLDVLVNNAGIPGPARPTTEITAADVATVHDTNVLGAVRTMRAFLPLLTQSPAPVVVNVSSGLGSTATAADPEGHTHVVPVWIPALAYACSKAALNMLTAQYAQALPRFRINAVDPGWTATDFNGHTGPKPVAEGARVIVRMATTGPQGPTAGFFNESGPLPW